MTLKWEGGPWSHLYDIYFGTSPDPPQIESNKEIGTPDPGVIETYTVSNLLQGTTYYWRIVDKTWALLGNSGPTWSFTTSGTAPGLTPYGGSPWPIPGIIQAENFDEGGQLVAYYDTTAGNSRDATWYRPGTDVDIETTTDTGGGYAIGKTRPGEWLKYSVNVAATGTYQFQARIANVGTGGTFNVEVDGADRTGPIAVPDTGGWQVWQTITMGGIQLSAGPHVIRVVLTTAASSGGVGDYNWFAFVETASTSPALISASRTSMMGASTSHVARSTPSAHSIGSVRMPMVSILGAVGAAELPLPATGAPPPAGAHPTIRASAKKQAAPALPPLPPPICPRNAIKLDSRGRLPSAAHNLPGGRTPPRYRTASGIALLRVRPRRCGR